MLRTGLVIDRRFQDHDTGWGHPERPARIASLLSALDEGYGREHQHIEPRSATVDEIARVHHRQHIERVAASRDQERSAFDADTPVSAHSYETSLLACGGLLQLVDSVMAGEVDNGFALVRPPGHHAEADRAMGFCLFNNVAVAARHLQQRHGLERVMIVDWDVHHGNGTQHTFEDDPSVLYLSTHQYPFYPGTGAAHQVGLGDGDGRTVNLPLPAGCGDGEFIHAFTNVVEPVCRQFAPQFVLISAGFDAHLRDHLAGMRVSADGFAAMARILLRAAAETAGHRCAAVLEGGYDLEALTESVLRVLDEMTGELLEESLPPTIVDEALFQPILEIQRKYWDL